MVSTPLDYRSQQDFTGPSTDFGSVGWEASHLQSTFENQAVFIQGIFHELIDFCDAVLEGCQPVVGTLEFDLHVMQVYEAALLSGGLAVTIDA